MIMDSFAPARVPALGLFGVLLLIPAMVAGQQSGLDQRAAEREDVPAARALAPSASDLYAPPPRADVPLGQEDESFRMNALIQERSRRHELSLIAAGTTLLVAGAFIDGSAGQIVMVSGALLAAGGVYRWVR